MRLALLATALWVASTAVAGQGSRPWTIADIVQIQRITRAALSQEGDRVAFIVKQSSAENNTVQYALYEVARTPGVAQSVPHKLVESDYLDDLTRHPGLSAWTLRGDFGKGVQLYDVDATGNVHLLLRSDAVQWVGGNEGVIRKADEGPHQTGILSYEWSPDGTALWYARMRLQDVPETIRLQDERIVYDSESMSLLTLTRTSRSPLIGTELRYSRLSTKEDRLLAFAPALEMEIPPYSRELTHWSSDGHAVEYTGISDGDNGQVDFARWTVDVSTSKATRLLEHTKSASVVFSALPARERGKFLAVEGERRAHRLVELGSDGRVERDLGKVPFNSFTYGAHPWWSARAKHGFVAVEYEDHDGLVSLPANLTVDAALQRISGHLSECAFTQDLSVAVCVRESQVVAPELVAIDLPGASVTALARPNADYDSIDALQTEYREWTNRFGAVATGYVTYPRGYQRGHAYPTVILTHGHDAQNKFAYDGFQWSHPLQVLAESGYLVLSVNDPVTDAKTRSAGDAFLTANSTVQIDAMQFFKNVSPMASMESALQWAIDSGLADPQRTAIVGYSRGCEVVEYALAHSKMFKLGIDGDAGGWNPGGWWATGTTQYRALYRSMFGGSAYDPVALPNYQKYAPAFHAREFAGPLLQQFAKTSASLGLELNSLLRDAGIPGELVLYPGETHLFWQPRHRAQTMELDLQWLDYWLLGKRSSDPAAQGLYQRWDRMKQQWVRS